jgi:hypothetical protein
MTKFCYPFLAVLAIVGCGGNDVVAPDASTASGTWVALGQVPGSHERWILTVSGGAVQGTGDWSAEACCGGVVTITGTARRDSLLLDLVYHRTMPTEIAGADPVHLDAVLDSPTDLTISVRGETGGVSEHFRKETQP